VARCRFIENYLDPDYGYPQSVPEDMERCVAVLEADYDAAPETKLWRMQRTWGEEERTTGEALLKESESWPDALRRDLLARLSRSYESAENAARAGELALTAVALGDTERVGAAVGHLVREGDEERAATLLLESELAADAWQAGSRLRAANRMKDASVALREIARHESVAFDLPAEEVARARLRAGDAEAAAAALGDTVGDRLAALHFDIALERRDFDAALAQIDFTDTDHFALQLGRFAMLGSRAPAMLLKPTMLAGLALFCFVLMMLALMPGLLLVPVHYRGLVRRVAGRLPPPLFDGIGLRHAWAGIAIFLGAQFVMPALLTPQAFGALLGDGDAGEAFLGLVGACIASLVLVFPMMRRLGRRALWGDAGIWKRSFWIPLAWLAIMAVAVGLHWLSGPADDGSQKLVRDMMESGALRYGAFASFVFIALLTPLLEEWVFRGLLLGGLSRHVSFGWANTLQAATFAVAHGDPARFLFFFAMGLACGALVKRTRSLALAVALHAFNNAWAWWLMTNLP
jgi:membrane protease YdiL (CAAX protease family)